MKTGTGSKKLGEDINFKNCCGVRMHELQHIAGSLDITNQDIMVHTYLKSVVDQYLSTLLNSHFSLFSCTDIISITKRNHKRTLIHVNNNNNDAL